MSQSDKAYAMKILMANVHVDDKKRFYDGLNDIFFPVSGETEIVVEKIVGDAPEGLDSLEEIANAINNDTNFYQTIQNSLEEKLTEEEFNVLLNKNLGSLSNEDILKICK